MSDITPETPVAATPPTPKNVADMLTMGDNDYHDGNYWHPSIGAVGNVVHIGITAYSEGGEKLPEAHFRAVVLPGEAVPVVLSSQAQNAYVVTDLTGSLWLTCAAPDCREPLTLVEDGKTLGELATPWAAHACAGATQADQDGGQADG
jgi:hypothetical protein